MQSIVEMEKDYQGLYKKEEHQEFEQETFEAHTKQETFNEKWGWFITLDMLSNNNPNLWDEITEWNVIRFLNTISYYHDKAKLNG